MVRDHSFPRQIFPNSAAQCAEFHGKFSIRSNYGSLNPTEYAVFVAGNHNWQIRFVYQINWHFRQAQYPVTALVAVMHFITQSCLHIVSTHSKKFSPATWTRSKYAIFAHLSLATSKFHNIPQKHRNSVEKGKFRYSAQNSVFRGKLWSVNMVSQISLAVQ